MRSARVALWPAIFLNFCIISYRISPDLGTVFVMATSLCFIASFGFLINDLKDVSVDTVNGSKRLQDASFHESRLLRWVSVAFLVGSLGLSAKSGSSGFLIMAFIAVGLGIYTFVARPKLLIANILAAILASSPLWAPFLVFDELPNFTQVGILVTALLLITAREMIFDAEDFRGDAYGHRRTFATVFDRHFAIKLSNTINIVGLVILWVVAILDVFQGLLPVLNSSIICLAIFVFSTLLLPPLFKLERHPDDLEQFKSFTQRSRWAMLLLPVIWLGL
jgi:4-hydroxybenzoate polyprenyltransferase